MNVCVSIWLDLPVIGTHLVQSVSCGNLSHFLLWLWLGIFSSWFATPVNRISTCYSMTIAPHDQTGEVFSLALTVQYSLGHWNHQDNPMILNHAMFLCGKHSLLSTCLPCRLLEGGNSCKATHLQPCCAARQCFFLYLIAVAWFSKNFCVQCT